jgi:transcriptional regulator with XRE-family HTH domain
VRNLKRLRKKNGWTQEIVAEKLDVNVSYYQRLEGKNCPSVGLDLIQTLARVLKAKPKEFFED